jgi:hypothetical protein
VTDRETDTAGPAPRSSIRQIADLLAWARRLTEQPFDVDPIERAAFQQAKAELLGRISNKASNNITDLDHHHLTEGGGL